MIKVTVLYPNEEGKNFDLDYYNNTHMPLVEERLTSFGMVRREVEKGISDTDPNAPPRFVAIGAMYFETVEGVHEGFMTHGRELMGDVKNFTDIQPQFQISEVVG
jgi:uncharacterized protein (TIGR02118 family)